MSMEPLELIRHYRIKRLFHFTDQANTPSIRRAHGLYSLRELEAHGIVVPRPGGNDRSHRLDRDRGLDRFVHLSWTRNHPMEFVARQERRIGRCSILSIAAEVVALPGTRFTLDVSNRHDAEILGFQEWQAEMDLEVLFTKTDWRDPDVQERLRRARRAEVLVLDHIPVELIQGL